MNPCNFKSQIESNNLLKFEHLEGGSSMSIRNLNQVIWNANFNRPRCWQEGPLCQNKLLTDTDYQQLPCCSLTDSGRVNRKPLPDEVPVNCLHVPGGQRSPPSF